MSRPRFRAWLAGRGWIAGVAVAQVIALLVAAAYVLAATQADHRAAGRFAARQTQLDRIEHDVQRTCAPAPALRCEP